MVIDGGPLDGSASAGERASLDLLDGLVGLGAQVSFLPMGSRGARDLELLDALRGRGLARVYSAPHRPRDVADRLAEHPVDVVIAHRPGPAAMTAVALQRHPEAARIYWGHDIHGRRLVAQQAVRGDVEGHRARATMLAERRCWNFFDLAVYPTQREAALVAEVAGPDRSAACPYFLLAGADLPAAIPARAGRHGLLMVGGAAHAPNLDAVEWAVGRILPLLWASLPDIRLTVVGDWPAEVVGRLGGENVHFTGRVSDSRLRQLHDEALCLFEPLRFGSGTRRKLVAAMGLGLPVITTSEGQQGLLVRDGRGIDDGILIAETPTALAGAIAKLRQDAALWQRCADTARRAVTVTYDQHHYTAGIAHTLATGVAIRNRRR
ncbi:MAG: hypothetical protein RLZ55_571 [Actinomycetota bacterium]